MPLIASVASHCLWLQARTVLYNGLLLCLVGSIESLMTAEVVSTMTDTSHDSGRVVAAMGLGNLISGFLGGMGGNAMIGLSTIVCLNGGGKSRIAPVTTAVLVFVMCAFAYPMLNYIPLSSLVGIMLIVILHTFQWFFVPVLLTTALPMSARDCLQRLAARAVPARRRASGKAALRMRRKIDRMDALIVFVVTILTLLTNLVYAVGVGLLISCARFSWAISSGNQTRPNHPNQTHTEQSHQSTPLSWARSSSELRVTHEIEGDVKTYTVDGPLFFASSKAFTSAITEKVDPDYVEILFTHGELFDYTAIAALASVAKRYEAVGKEVVFRKLSERSVKRVAKAAHLVSEINITSSSPHVSSEAAGRETGSDRIGPRIVRTGSYDTFALDISSHEPESSGASVASRHPAAHPGLTFASGFAGFRRSRKIKYKRARKHTRFVQEEGDSAAGDNL